MIENCTPATCPTIGALEEKYQIAQAEQRWRDAINIMAEMTTHERGAECKAVTK
jgi:hypothetical protein